VEYSSPGVTTVGIAVRENDLLNRSIELRQLLAGTGKTSKHDTSVDIRG